MTPASTTHYAQSDLDPATSVITWSMIAVGFWSGVVGLVYAMWG